MNFTNLSEKHDIEPDPLKDQFFLNDKEVIKKIVEFANLSQKDTVLEVGAGIGNLTKEIAKFAGKVIAFEIDKGFKPFLDSMPSNVEVHYENAWEFVQLQGKFRKKKEYNKIVSNPPYSFIEPFLHNLTFLDYDKVILLVPMKFLKKGEKWGVFDSFFEVGILMKISKNKFYPKPKTDSVVINLKKLPDPIIGAQIGLYLRQYMYQHERQLVKNSLMEGIIRYAKRVHSKKLTKNQARARIADKNIDNALLENYPESKRIYELVGEKFRKLKI